MKYEEIESFNQTGGLLDSCKREQTRKFFNLHHQSQSVDVYILQVIFGTKSQSGTEIPRAIHFLAFLPKLG